jgi:hypothetical protein
VELLYLGSVLDHFHAFTSFKIDDTCKLAEKFYTEDFALLNLHGSRIQLEYYKLSMDHPNFENIDYLTTLYHHLVDTGLKNDFDLVNRMIRMVLALLVSSSMTKQTFSSMKFIKNQL